MTISLTIAGSDSCGGAGIQADLKTFSALGTYGMSVITAVTAQNTQGVDSVYPIPADFIRQQLLSLFNDSTIDSIKIGMMMNKEIILTTADILQNQSIQHLVLDTVMISKSGHRLLQEDAILAIKQSLVPLATLITPNLPEAAALLGCCEAKNEDEMQQQGLALLELGCKAVLIKGGHLLSDESPDYLITPKQINRLSASRIQTKNTHGTGCTLSSAITALLPKMPLLSAIEQAKCYLNGAIMHSEQLKVGKGIGPTHHFYQWW